MAHGTPPESCSKVPRITSLLACPPQEDPPPQRILQGEPTAPAPSLHPHLLRFPKPLPLGSFWGVAGGRSRPWGFQYGLRLRRLRRALWGRAGNGVSPCSDLMVFALGVFFVPAALSWITKEATRNRRTGIRLVANPACWDLQTVRLGWQVWGVGCAERGAPVPLLGGKQGEGVFRYGKK